MNHRLSVAIQRPSMRGFTLLDLAIVLVVLGLLAGGTLMGVHLLRTAQLKSVSMDVQKYSAAFEAFRNQYGAMPGDFAGATRIWGQEDVCPGDHTSPSTTTATCDGNNDGVITTTGFNEQVRAWQHLANAGLIEGSYSGVMPYEAGASIPRSGVDSQMGWVPFYYGRQSGHSQIRDGDYGHVFLSKTPGAYHFLRPEEMRSIDTKFDDGQPATGRIVTHKDSLSPGCATSDHANAQYTMGNPELACSLIYKHAFTGHGDDASQ